jgi:hypothetical protein
VGDGGTIVATNNGGGTWNPQVSTVSESLYSVYFASATQGWAVGFWGELVATSDGGITWEEQPSPTGSSINEVFFRSPDRGWAVSDVGAIFLYGCFTTSPAGDSVQSFCSGATVANLAATGSNIHWYDSESGGAPLAGETLLSDGTSYYATRTAGDCESSSRLRMTATVNHPSSTTTVEECDSFTWNNQHYTESGIYTFTSPSDVGCDSVATLNLTINKANTETTVSGSTITVGVKGATYQWQDCNKAGAPVEGETNQSFTAEKSGHYNVLVTEDGCVGISVCVAVIGTGINKYDVESFSVYPNPTTNQVTLVAEACLLGFDYLLYDNLGKTIKSAIIKSYKTVIDLNELPKGLYFIGINNSTQPVKVIKQ